MFDTTTIPTTMPTPDAHTPTPPGEHHRAIELINRSDTALELQLSADRDGIHFQLDNCNLTPGNSCAGGTADRCVVAVVSVFASCVYLRLHLRLRLRLLLWMCQRRWLSSLGTSALLLRNVTDVDGFE